MSALAASNQRIRRLRRLMGRRSARVDEGVFVLEGPTLVGDALASGATVEGIYVDEGLDAGAITDRAAAAGVPVHLVASGVLDEVADVVTPRPILAVAARASADLAGVLADARSTGRPLVVLIDVRDPGNVGTIIRAAEASGVAGLICSTGTVDPWAPKVVRSSAGAVLHLPVVVDIDPAEALSALLDAGIARVGTLLDGTPYDEADLVGSIALVFGNEANGLPSELGPSIDLAVTIPMVGRSESLNVAMAASIMCFEALRQRRNAGAPRTSRTPL